MGADPNSPRNGLRVKDGAMASPVPLEGVRVVEFSHMVMGPTCGLVLADLGADVVKVEPPGQGDNTRRLPGAGAGFFITFNRNKRSVSLDVANPRGLAFAKELVARADVLVENFRPGRMDEIGLSYEALAQTNPRLVYCSLKGFLSGPYEHRPALDEVVQMMGGLAYMTGPPGRPLRAGAPVNDMMGGMFAVIGILAALHERERTGAGQHVKSALYENVAFLVASSMAQFAVTGKPAAPMPDRISAWAVYDVFETSDNLQIFVGVVTDTQWRTFCDVFGQPTLAADSDLATNPLRVAARERLIPMLRQLFKAFTREQMVALCEQAKLPYAPIRRPDELFDDPQLNVPGGMVDVSLPDGRPTRVPALPLQFGSRRLGRRRDIPRAGEHSVAIAKELGMDSASIEALIADGVLGVDSGDR
jgi:crotonobetainyl-CoA:carnitine CoA-transferase CaiB-like acyl-CoA transferase